MVQQKYRGTVLSAEALGTAPADPKDAGKTELAAEIGKKPSATLRALAMASSEIEQEPIGSQVARSARSRLNRLKLVSILTTAFVKAGVNAADTAPLVDQAADCIVAATRDFAAAMGDAGRLGWVRHMAEVHFAELFERLYTDRSQDIAAVVGDIRDTSIKGMSIVDRVPLSGDGFPSPTSMDPVTAVRLSLMKAIDRIQKSVDGFPMWEKLYGVQPAEVLSRITGMVNLLAADYAGIIAAGGTPDDLLISRQSMIANIGRLLPEALKATLAQSIETITKDAAARSRVRIEGFPFSQLEADLRKQCDNLTGALQKAEPRA